MKKNRPKPVDPSPPNQPLPPPGSGYVPFCPRCGRWMLAAWVRKRLGIMIAWCDHGANDPSQRAEQFTFRLKESQ